MATPENYPPQQVAAIRGWLGAGSLNIFGMPYAGKDIQANRLGKLLDAPVLGGGDILRNSKIPKDVQEVMEAGELIPTDDYLRIVLPYLSKAEFAERPLVLTSVGRWHGEEEGVVAATNAAKHPIRAAVLLQVPEGTVWQRWEEEVKQEGRKRGQRSDDAFEKIDVRLKEFREKTAPVIEYYRNLDLLVEVDGTMEPNGVTHSILAELALRAQTEIA